ncbi:hypothetical protein IC235_09255 [Hymenobacter sp. BT664]|uniref:Glycine zipper domain-containing protein n=1 Tax=Hymenobacter montanus TaxID=2771359 RepID=A0A927BCR3_9BACT|nr:hypothetical protein [Hymenobacter montanus]MBD2768076.1 hypothetical protein [Hymenobacter montanus]
MSEYPKHQYRTAFRATLHPDYESISDEEADALLESVTAGLSPQEAEAYMEGLGSWLRKAGQTIAKSAPIWAPIAGSVIGSIVPGAGTAIGGAVGGLVGNVAGRLANSPRANAGSVIGAGLQGAVAGGLGAAGRGTGGSGIASTVAGLAGTALGTGAGRGSTVGGLASAAGLVGAALAGGAPAGRAGSTATPVTGTARPATRQLLGLLNSPHLNRAVIGQVNGNVGRATVPVQAGGRRHDISFATFMNALLQLAQRAATEAPAPSADTNSTSYLTDSEGLYAYDPASPEHRTEGLLALLQQEHEEAWAENDQEDYAEAAGPGYDPLTEWFLESGMIRH